MMQRLYRGEAQGIICWKLDRLARNPVDGGSIIWAIKQHGIKVMTPAQSYAREDDNIILMYIEFGMAQKYVVSGQSKPARDGQLKSGHFEEDIALSAMGVAQGRDEYTQREPATFDNNAVEARLVIPADCA